jgi:hypothetical protein
VANWRRWGPILFGVAVLVVFVGIGAVIFSVAWFRENVTIEPATEASAVTTFDDVRRRHAEKAPLVEVRDAGVKRNPPPDGTRRTPLTTLHVLAWDPREERLVKFSLPFWFLRLKETPIQFGTEAGGLDDIGLQLTVGDIERYGPGIVADVELRRGARAMLWAE